MSDLFRADASLIRRKRKQRLVTATLLAASSLSVLVLAVLLYRLAAAGLRPVMASHFWTGTYSRLDLLRGTAGVMDSLYASLIVLLLTLLIAVPVGTAAGIYLQEYAKKGRFVRLIQATVANLAGVPSVVYGLLGLAVFVRMMGLGASYLAAAFTLATLILPMLIVSTQEALKTVPESVRQASFGLGASKWQTVRHHVLPYALPGVLTGQILALSRAAGETAPILLLGIPVYQTLLGFGPLDSGAPLQLRIYYLASDPTKAAIALGNGAILLLLLVTLALNLAAILVRHRLSKKIKW